MREREIFLDQLRAAATCAVVLLHTVTGVMDHTDMSVYPLEKKAFLVILDLICWCVPVFLMISGYLFLNPQRKLGMGRMLTKYCRRIVLALFLFGVPYACMEQIVLEGSFGPEMVGRAFVMVVRGETWSHMWYLYLILVLYLLTPAIRLLLQYLPRQVLYGILAVLFMGSSLLPYLSKLTGWELPGLPDWGIYFFYYISGSFFTCTGGNLSEDTKGKRGRVLGTAALFLAAAMGCSRLSGGYTLQMAYNYPFTTVLSFLLFGWGWAGGMHAGQAASFWKRAGELSFAVYLIHPVFLNAAYKFLHVTPLSFPLGISLPLFFLAALIPSAVIAWILRKIPLLRSYVL